MTYEFEGRTEKEAIELAASQLGLQRDQFDVEILESQKNSLFKKGYVKICVHTIEDENTNKVNQSKKIYANPLPESEFEEKLLFPFLEPPLVDCPVLVKVIQFSARPEPPCAHRPVGVHVVLFRPGGYPSRLHGTVGVEIIPFPAL